MKITELQREAGSTLRVTAKPIKDPELQELAQSVLNILQVATEVGIAHRASSNEFPLPPEKEAFEHAVVARFDQLDAEARNQAMKQVIGSLSDPPEERRRRFGKAASADPRARRPIAVQVGVPAVNVERLSRRALGTAGARSETISAAPEFPHAGTLDTLPAPGSLATPGGGPVALKYKKFESQLGAKIGKEEFVQDFKGRTVRCQRSQNGIVVLGPKPEAFAVFGPIFTKFKQLGDIQQFPGGPPVTDTVKQSDGGFVSHFHGNYSILKGPSTPACEVHGAIRQRYAALKFDKGGGYPLTDELPANDLVGRISRFERGDIPWNPKTGARWIPEPVAAHWRNMGALDGILGYPLQEGVGVIAPNTPFAMKFQGGLIQLPAGPQSLTVALPTKNVDLFLETLEVKQTTEIGKDEVNLHGVRIAPKGEIQAMPKKDFGKFSKGQKKNVQHKAASWNLLEGGFAGWGLSLGFVAGFWEADVGGGESEFLKKIISATKEAIEEAVSEGLAKLGDVVTAASKSKIVGWLVSTILGLIAGWLLDKFWAWLKQLWNDDLFPPYAVSLSLPDAWVGDGKELSPLFNLFTKAHGGHYVGSWRFKRA